MEGLAAPRPGELAGGAAARRTTLVQGEASFVDAHTIRAGGRELTAERILIATGSRTAVPSIPGIEDVPWLDHISALDLEVLPESLLVVGGGPVGLEFAQIFARFGSRVTIVQNGTQIAARDDAEAARELQAALEDGGDRDRLRRGRRASRATATSSRRRSAAGR